MKNKFKFVFLLGMIMLSGLSMLSCSNDDDDDSGRGSKGVGVLDKSTGLRVKSVGNYNYVYQEDGRLLRCTNGKDRWEFSYNPDKIVHIENGDYGNAKESTVTYNGNGYVSSLNCSWKGGNDDDYIEETLNDIFSYDGNGHLTKVVRTQETNYVNTGYLINATVTNTLTWSNNLLLKVVETIEGSLTDNTSKILSKSSDVNTYSFSYDNEAMTNYENKYLQYAYGFTAYYFTKFYVCLFCVGLLGNGPAYLPSSSEHVENSWPHNYRYVFNSYGAISKDYEEASLKASYSYDHVEGSSDGTSPFTR